ncbi:MAG: serine protease [Holophagales bacterium]|nr:serine protease [Holophagales bacterium]
MIRFLPRCPSFEECRATLLVALVMSALVSAREVRCEAAEEPGAALYDRLSRAVLRLERHVAEGGSKTSRQPVGTAFLWRQGDRTSVVTARHVVEGGGRLRARVYPLSDDAPWELTVDEESWVFHPSRGSDGNGSRIRPRDLAAAAVVPPAGLSLSTLPDLGEGCAGTVPRAWPPTAILVAGYPRDLGLELDPQRPVLRAGIVAMAADEPFLPYRFPEKGLAHPGAMALDARTFAGDSGAPVFLRDGFERCPRLLGVVAAGYDRLGLVIAEPASALGELLAVLGWGDLPQRPRWRPPEELDRARSEASSPRSELGPDSLSPDPPRSAGADPGGP